MHFSSKQSLLWYVIKIMFLISMVTFVMGKSLPQIMQLINPDYPRMRNWFLNFYYHLLWCSSKNSICCLICLIFLKSSWWPFLIFSAETYLNFRTNLLKPKIRKEYKKIFCGQSKVFKNISWPINICKNPPVLLLHISCTVP